MRGASLLFVTLAACGSSQPAPPADSGPAVPADGNVPCDVLAVFQQSCLTCHGATPSNNAPMPLVSFADLVARSPIDGKTMAQRAALRMADASSPMPPAGGVAQADIDAVQAWIAAGYASGPGGCDSKDPFAVDPTCTKMTKWTRGNLGSADMNPGMACIKCHAGNTGPLFSISGTVYPTAHEPDLCNGGVSGAQVVVTDKNGKDTTLTVRATSGNFYSVVSIPTPFTAKVLYQGRTRAMNTPQTDGDCNKCHTQDGANGAPGRVLLP